MAQTPNQPICCYRSQLDELRLNEEFVDMEIIVGSETYRVHRVIMAAKSDYFRAAMSSELKECRNKCVGYQNEDRIDLNCSVSLL